MVYTVSVTVPPDRESDEAYIRNEVFTALKQKDVDTSDAVLVKTKRSIDARHHSVKLILRYDVYIGERPASVQDSLPEWKHADGSKKVIIVGSGPAGLFGAFTLLEAGVQPIIIERGEQAGQRKRDIALISTKGVVGADSNYCFGEGGAGTFSDGKLYTRSDKRGNLPLVLKIFAHFGASERILTDAHPHIGTEKLPAIITAMRNKIIELGGECHWNMRVTDLITQNANGSTSVCGVKTENTKTGEIKEFTGDAVLLATGHSATDIYEIITRHSPESLEAKTFAVGVRVEHPRTTIDDIQFHGKKTQNLGAAEYRLTSQQDGRGVYSFCMCPGGFVVPSSTAPEQIVINGMSASGRNSKWSNAAIVVETRPEDIPEQYRVLDCPALAGLRWRTALEHLTWQKGDGQKAPAQRLKDFLNHKDSTSLPASSYAPGLVASRLDTWLPPQIAKRLAAGFKDFNKHMKGFICDDALIIASETRTSTPVRILRNAESGECKGLAGLYPAGEGSGYSGGIASSAMDGVKQCKAILNALH